MAELSEKFGQLMARMAKTDADLFRTIGDHNKAVTEQVLNLTTEDEPDSSFPALQPQALLPPEERDKAALEKRFNTCAGVYEWLEEQLGPPPKHRKTWNAAVTAITEGQWPTKPVPTRSTTTSSSANIQILKSLESLHQRMDSIESVLSALVGLMEDSQRHLPRS